MRNLAWLSLLVVAACPKPAPQQSGTEDEARALLAHFNDKDADRHALTIALRPHPEDYAAVFDGPAAEKARGWYERGWAADRLVVGGAPEQTEVQLVRASTEELRARADAAKQFPGGYQRIADRLKPELVFYVFKFTKPGDASGTAYDGLVFVNGHWALFPKPFLALR